ncbi:MAG: PKD domain-containing protein [Haliscomenobacteraceae bacterium CHB4]|nr:hypothetical protein [Saprospiraceae bacterium]MCE7922005.1 PKD domain-containing protein [Haliscomenobacteraceae bacterium CHB4]
MTVRLRLFSLLGAIFLFAAQLQAQIFTGTLNAVSTPALNERFTACEVYQLDVTAFNTWIKSNPNFSQSELHLGNRHWNLELVPSGLMANYKLQVLTPQGIEVSYPANKAFKGYEKNSGGRVALTVDEDFIAGLVYEGDQVWYIEPYRYYNPSASVELFVVYNRDAVIRDNIYGTCLVLDEEDKAIEFFPHDEAEESGDGAKMQACYQADIALAADRSMFDKYGSVQGVEDHNIAVLNDVQVNYIGNFNHDIEFNIVTQFVVTGNDPWSSSNDAGTLLSSFRTWGNNGNFGTAFDVASLWTNRDFSGSTIGIAYLSGVCNSFKYNCLQDFTANSEFLRVLQAHELGHNFSAGHDASGCPGQWIMCPSVNSSNSWSSASINSINNFIAPLVGNCLSSCGPPPPPLVADFSWDPDPGCEDEPVQFTDQSSGNISSRTWTFPGGIPPSSTQTNPVVTWNNPGTYNVTLTLQGQGGPVSKVQTVTIQPDPVANFTFTVSGLTVNFNSTSSNADSYFWDFGDGGTSTEEDPEYTYLDAGIYTVVLTVTNECGTSSKTLLVNTAPIANFSANPTSGCATLVVQFTNESSYNATSFSWLFPGGIPSSSNQQHPVVQYPVSGSYNVTLVAINVNGVNTLTKTNYINVQTIPTANFTHSVNGLTVTFTNNSNGATSYLWNFGDGNTSTEQNPVHTYAVGGVYTVILTTTNDCGSNNASKTVIVSAPPVAAFTASPTSGCGPLTVQFTNQSSGNPTNYNWSFPGGNPSSSTQQNPVVVYNNPGTYSVTLTVSNAAGTSTATQNNYITVNAVPTASFTSSINGATVTFTNNSNGATSYLWNFGDGQTSNAANPTHTYANDGTYTVTLSATNACGTTTATQTVVIVTPPTAGFSASPTSGCAPLTVQFTNQSSPNVTSWNWQFPGGSPSSSTAQNPLVVYNTPGIYSVTLTVSNAAGSNTATQNNYITVNTTPTAGFTSSINGATVTFTNNSNGATSYLWNFGDGQTSNATNPTHTYANDGTYTVTLSATNACGTTTATQTVVIVTPPTAGFSASPTSGCAPLTVQFTNQSSPNVTSWNWQFPGGSPSSSTAQNPVVVYNTPGTYSVTLTVSNAAGSNTATQNNYITVNTTPTAGFTSSINGATVAFTNNSNNATSYLWNFGDGQTSNATNPTHTYANDGTYTVTLSATNACGTTTATQTVVIVTPPTAGFSASPTSGCAPLTVQFTNQSSPNVTSWNWQFPGGSPSSSSAQNPVVVYNMAGTYSVTLTVSNAAGSNTATQTNYITVNAAPTAGFTSSVDSLTATFTNTSNNATSYLWNFGDGQTSNATNPVHTYEEDGNYTVTLSATNACGTTTFTQNVVIITAPSAGFTANTTTGCAALTVQFQNLSSANATSWEWTFPGGTPSSSTAQNPLVVYNTPGVYDVTLIAYSPGGSSMYTQQGFITVLGPPTTNFTSNVNGLTVSFTNNSQNAVSYLWDFGDGSTSIESNPTHTYAAGGTYTITLSATNNCGTTTVTQQIVIESAPSAAFALSSSEGCAPFTVQFTNQSSPNATAFAWTFEGGQPASSNEANPSATWDQPGTYTVMLIASNAAGSDTASATVTVNTAPVAGFTAQTAGLSVVLTNNSVNADSYLWNFGDGATSTEKNPTHNYGATGNFTISLKATNECGTTEFSMQVEISGSAPLAAFTVNVNNGCVPFTVQFTDQSAGNPVSWQWQFTGATPDTSTAQNPTVTYSSTGTFPVTLIVTNLYGSDTLTVQNAVTAQSVPTSGFAYAINQGTVSFTNTSFNATTFMWNFGDGNTSSEANPVYTYSAPGTYTVELTAINVCGASTLQQTVVITTVGAGEPAWLSDFRLYPNPNTGQFTVEMSGTPYEEVEFSLFNAIGQLVKRDVAGFGAGTLVHHFDYGYLPAAVYTLRVRAGASAKYVKVAVQR